jgi:hypothetical protein
MCTFPKASESYGIISWSSNIELGPLESCVVCKEEKVLHELIAGPTDMSGSQLFSCRTHIWPTAQWLVIWTRFEMRQRILRLLKESGLRPEDLKNIGVFDD